LGSDYLKAQRNIPLGLFSFNFLEAIFLHIYFCENIVSQIQEQQISNSKIAVFLAQY
jgi:hypothetical protein